MAVEHHQTKEASNDASTVLLKSKVRLTSRFCNFRDKLSRYFFAAIVFTIIFTITGFIFSRIFMQPVYDRFSPIEYEKLCWEDADRFHTTGGCDVLQFGNRMFKPLPTQEKLKKNFLKKIFG